MSVNAIYADVIKGQGITAGYCGQGEESCPEQEQAMIKAWQAGWAIGTKQRSKDQKKREVK